MLKRSAPTRVAGGALAVVVAALLMGCFANPLDTIMDKAGEDGAKNVAEDILKNATGGEVGVEFGELPEDFPAEVTLVSENVQQSISSAEGSMMVLVSDPRSMQELDAQVKKDYAGWEEIARSDMGEMISAVYRKEEIALSVGGAVMQGSDGEDNTVSYTVIRLAE